MRCENQHLISPSVSPVSLNYFGLLAGTSNDWAAMIHITVIGLLAVTGLFVFLLGKSISPSSWKKRREQHLAKVPLLEGISTISDEERSKMESIYNITIPDDAKTLYELNGYFYGVSCEAALGSDRNEKASSFEYVTGSDCQAGWYYIDGVELDVASVKYLQERLSLSQFLVNPNRKGIKPVTVRFILKKADMGTPLAFVVSINDQTIFRSRAAAYKDRYKASESSQGEAVIDTEECIKRCAEGDSGLSEFLINDFEECLFQLYSKPATENSPEKPLSICNGEMLALFSSEIRFERISAKYPGYTVNSAMTGREIIETYRDHDYIFNPESEEEFFLERDTIEHLYRS